MNSAWVPTPQWCGSKYIEPRVMLYRQLWDFKIENFVEENILWQISFMKERRQCYLKKLLIIESQIGICIFFSSLSLFLHFLFPIFPFFTCLHPYPEHCRTIVSEFVLIISDLHQFVEKGSVVSTKSIKAIFYFFIFYWNAFLQEWRFLDLEER